MIKPESSVLEVDPGSDEEIVKKVKSHVKLDPEDKSCHINDMYYIVREKTSAAASDVDINNKVVETLNAVRMRIVKTSTVVIKNDTLIEFTCSRHTWSATAERWLAHAMTVRGCPLCTLMTRLFPSNLGISPESRTRDIDEKAVVFTCKLRHKFLMEDIYQAPGSGTHKCPVHAIETRARQTRGINILLGDTVYTGPETFLRFKCQECDGQSYTRSGFIYGKDHCGIADCKRNHAPNKQREILRTKRVFEIYFGVKFEDFDSSLFQRPYPLGYNADLGIAYYHERATADAASAAQRLTSLGVTCFVISKTSISSPEIIRDMGRRLVELDMYTGKETTLDAKLEALVRTVRSTQGAGNRAGQLFDD